MVVSKGGRGDTLRTRLISSNIGAQNYIFLNKSFSYTLSTTDSKKFTSTKKLKWRKYGYNFTELSTPVPALALGQIDQINCTNVQMI